jgi:hypothetical protein
MQAALDQALYFSGGSAAHGSSSQPPPHPLVYNDQLVIIYSLAAPTVDALLQATCFPAPVEHPDAVILNQVTDAHVACLVAEQEYRDAAAANRLDMVGLLKVYRAKLRHKISLGDTEPPRSRVRLPDPRLHLVYGAVQPFVAPPDGLAPDNSRGLALRWVCFRTMQLLKMLRTPPSHRSLQDWGQASDGLLRAWRTAAATARYSDTDVNQTHLMFLKSHYYLWRTYGLEGSEPGFEKFIAECNVYYLWLCLDGTCSAPCQRPNLPTIPDIGAPMMPVPPEDGHEEDGDVADYDVDMDMGMDMDSPGSGGEDEDISRPDQRQRREEQFAAKKSQLVQQILMLRGDTLDVHRSCGACKIDGQPVVLFCTECDLHLCTACDHARHRLKGMHRRHTLHSGAKLAALETVEIDPSTSVSRAWVNSNRAGAKLTC